MNPASLDIVIGKYMLARATGDGWAVFDRHGGLLGRVQWYPRWKMYEFLPSPGSGYSAGCCRDLARFLDEKTKARKDGPHVAA